MRFGAYPDWVMSLALCKVGDPAKSRPCRGIVTSPSAANCGTRAVATTLVEWPKVAATPKT